MLSTLECEPVQALVLKAVKTGQIKALDEMGQVSEAAALGIISSDQVIKLNRDYVLRRKIIMVDDFDPAQLAAG